MILLPASVGFLPDVGNAYYLFRILINAENGTASPSITEFSAYESLGGANFLSGGTASSSSGTAANAFDGGATTNCVFSGGLPGWVAMSLASQKAPRYLYTLFSGATSVATNFSIQGSNDGGATWDELYSSTTGQWNAFDSAGKPFGIWPIYGEVYRLEIHAVRGGGTDVRLPEIQVLDGASANILTGGLAYASSEGNNTTNAASKALDGSATTAWANIGAYDAVTGGHTFWGYILPDSSHTTPVTLTLSYSGSFSSTQCPSSFSLLKMSKGGRSWATLGGPYSWPSGNSFSVSL